MKTTLKLMMSRFDDIPVAREVMWPTIYKVRRHLELPMDEYLEIKGEKTESPKE